MTDSLITDLARTERLAVIARAAVFRFKDQAIDPQKAGQELGATVCAPRQRPAIR